MVANLDCDAAAETGTRPTATSSLGEPLLDAAAVATYLGVDKTTVYRLAATVALPSVEIAPRVLRFRPADVRAFVERRVRNARPRGRVQRLLSGAAEAPGAPELN